MKQVRSALLFVISAVVFGACFDPPEFGNNPAIEFKGVSFGKTENGDEELIVSVNFKDGDGDMGLSATVPEHAQNPYHDINFFANDNGQLFPLAINLVKNFTGYYLGKSKKTPKNTFYEIIGPEKKTGEIITLQSRDQGFQAFPHTLNRTNAPYTKSPTSTKTIYLTQFFSTRIMDI